MKISSCCVGTIPIPSFGRAGTRLTQVKCQTELGDLSCCVGAEWVLKETAEPVTAAAAVTPETDRAEEFCCLASEYFVR